MRIVVIGGGPAGLMAAEAASAGGAQVDLYDAMASVGRKFLLAGKGGLNLTHSDPSELFLSRYGTRREQIEPLLAAFGPDALRVLPSELKAAPLLRAWLRRPRAGGLTFHMRQRWIGWNNQGDLSFATQQGA